MKLIVKMLMSVILIISASCYLKKKSKDLNKWGQLNCEFKNEEERNFEKIDTNEQRWFATTTGSNGCGNRKITKKETCEIKDNCHWSKSKNECMSRCYGCYYITNIKKESSPVLTNGLFKTGMG